LTTFSHYNRIATPIGSRQKNQVTESRRILVNLTKHLWSKLRPLIQYPCEGPIIKKPTFVGCSYQSWPPLRSWNDM